MENVIQDPVKHLGNAAGVAFPQIPQEMAADEERFFLLMYIRLCEEPHDELTRVLDARTAADEERLVENISWSQFFEQESRLRAFQVGGPERLQVAREYVTS